MTSDLTLPVTSRRLRDLLYADGPALLDGGMGTLLQDRGLFGGGAGELWNVERPEQVRAALEEYADAGAQWLTTNTFGGSRPRLDMHGLGDRVHELNAAAATLAREVAEPRGLLVAGNVGPTGELLDPLGTLTGDQAREIFAAQLRGLLDGGVDLILVETLSDLGEAEAAIAAARDVAPNLPLAVSMSFDTNLRTMMGVSPAAAVRALAAAGADAVGANCGRGPEEMEHIAAELVATRDAESPHVAVLAQSNAGLPQLVGDRFVFNAEPRKMAVHAVALKALGVDLIGACCGSTPDHIAAMRAALDA